MIRGYFSLRSGNKRPFVTCSVEFPSTTRPRRQMVTQFLIDTGADRTILAPGDAEKLPGLGIVPQRLPAGPSSTGIGGRVGRRIIDAILKLDSVAIPLALAILATPTESVSPNIPSIMGRDILGQFALFIEERTNRVLLLDASEADALAL